MEKPELVKLILKNKIVILKLTPFQSEIDVQDLVNIDIHNIVGELLTFPVLLNRAGNLLADADRAVDESELNIEIKEAELYCKHRESLFKQTNKNPTEKEVNSMVILDEEYQQVRRGYMKAKQDKANINSFYWALQTKGSKLEILSGGRVKPEEFEAEIVEATINGIQIKVHQKIF